MIKVRGWCWRLRDWVELHFIGDSELIDKMIRPEKCEKSATATCEKCKDFIETRRQSDGCQTEV